jgi:putative transposase
MTYRLLIRWSASPVFPNKATIVWLVGAVLFEQNDERAMLRRYMSLEMLEPLSNNAIATA